MGFIKWLIINGGFSGFLYFGFIEGIEGAVNVVIFIAFAYMIFSLFLFNADVQKAIKEKLEKDGVSVPRWIDIVFDISATLFLIWHGAIFTGIAYGIHTILIAAAIEKTKLSDNK